MKFTEWELEFLIDALSREIRRRVSQQRSTKRPEKLKLKLETILNKKRSN